MILLTVSTIVEMRDNMDRNSAISSGILAVVLIAIGAVIGFRDYLPKWTVATCTIGMGLMAIALGSILAAWIGYNFFIERQAEFRPRGIVSPFVMIAVGIGFLKRGISALKLKSSDTEFDVQSEGSQDIDLEA